MDEPEDQDETVERCGALLMSEDIRKNADGYVALTVVPLKCKRPWDFARILQEIPAYKGGAVVERVVRGALIPLGSDNVVNRTETRDGPQNSDNEARCGEDPVHEFIVCSWVLGLLSRSVVAVERCLAARGASDRQNAKDLYRSLAGNALKAARHMAFGTWEMPLQRWEEGVFVHGEQTVNAALDSIENFARVSRVFREAMKDALGESSLFESFGVFLAEEYRAAVPAGKADRNRRVLANLAASLAVSPDSQIWALDKGLLKLVAAIYEATTLRQVRDDNRKEKHPPLFRCNMVLYNLLQTPATTDKMRAHNALTGFRPHKRKMNEADPLGNVWFNFEGRLQGVPLQWPALSLEFRQVVPAEVLCSWKMCSAGQEVDAGKKYGKCALCQVARYCSKEHQKLHWRTHKVHCQGARARNASPKNNLGELLEVGSTSEEHGGEGLKASAIHEGKAELSMIGN